METSLVQQARELRANRLLGALLDDYQRQQMDTLCHCPSEDIPGLQRASIAWQVIHDLRSFIDERTNRYANPEG